MGPGPGPTPVLSLIGGPVEEATAGIWGDGRAGEAEASLTADWFEGRINYRAFLSRSHSAVYKLQRSQEV